MIIRVNLDWLSFSVTNIPPGYYYVFENLIEYYNLEKQDYLIRGCEIAFNDYMNVFWGINYVNVELKPLFFWTFINELILDEEYYINYIKTIFNNIGYKILDSCIKFNRVDLAIDYIGEFVPFDKSFNFISKRKIESIDTIRNVGHIKNGMSSYLNGTNWTICRYEKFKEIDDNKSYYPDVYREKSVIRLEIRLKKDYLKNYSKNRNKFYYLFKILLQNIDDGEIKKLEIIKLFDEIQKVKSIRKNFKGEFMILKEKIVNDILNDLESLNALYNIYFNKDTEINFLLNEIKNRYKGKNLKNKEKHYRYYLNLK